MNTQSLLPWYGADASAAADIAELLKPAKHVTIPFCGGLGILKHLSARSVLANDKCEMAINFYKVFNSQLQERLIELCQHTLCHFAELREANLYRKPDVGTKLDRAWAYWTRCWLGIKGKGGTKDVGKTGSIRRNAGGGDNASRIISAAEDLNEWAPLIKKCEFEWKDFRPIIEAGHDKEECGFYIDAPWVKEGMKYEEPFTEKDHRDLAALLHRFQKAIVVIRYGDDPLLRELYGEDHWVWIEGESRTQARKARNEFWICRKGQDGVVAA